MNYTEIHVSNPINMNSIDALFEEIKDCNSLYLMINIGEHNFKSIEIIKELKNRFSLEKDTLNRFNKIVFLHPPQFQNKSDDDERYNFFNHKDEAIDWLDK